MRRMASRSLAAVSREFARPASLDFVMVWPNVEGMRSVATVLGAWAGHTGQSDLSQRVVGAARPPPPPRGVAGGALHRPASSRGTSLMS